MQEKKYSISLIDQIKLHDELPPQEYIWRSITPGSLGFIYGPSKSGKTTFCENLGMSIAYGRKDYFGSKIENAKPSKVLFISMEEYWRQRVERNKKQLAKLEVPEELQNNYVVVNENFPRIFIGTEELKSRIQAIIDEVRPKVVFIDSMTRMATKDIEDSSVSGAISVALRELANENEVAIMVIHHTHKLKGKAITIDSLAGSRVLAQEADFMIGINKTVIGQRYYKEVATRYGQEKEDVILFDIDENQWLQPTGDMSENKVLEMVDRRRRPEIKNEIMTMIQNAYEKNRTITTGDIINELDEKIKKSQVYKQLENLEKDAKIVRSNSGIIPIGH